MKKITKIKIIWTLWFSVLFFIPLDGRANEINNQSFISIKELDVPTKLESNGPNLAVSKNGIVYLSWMESFTKTSSGEAISVTRLSFSTYEKGGWSQPKTIAEGNNWFVNWADFPALAIFDDETLAAHWLVKNGEDTYAYDVNIAYSSDKGITWGPPIIPHRDGTSTQHGFVSMLPWSNNRLLVTWLDGRVNAEGLSQKVGLPTTYMTLRTAILDKQGRLFEETLLDSRTCTCCQTSLGLTSTGAVLIYRDRTPNEIRDIAIVHFQNGIWSKSSSVHKDGWKIAGCPVNGPALSTKGLQAAVTWFTAAQGIPRVYVAFSSDGGKSFSKPIQVDDKQPLGRVDIILLSDGSALLSWLELAQSAEELRLRRVTPEGIKGQAITLASTKSGRTLGFPRMVRNGQEIHMVWQAPSKIRTAVLTLNKDQIKEF